MSSYKREAPVKVYHITLTEDQCISLANLAITLYENLESLRGVRDSVSGDTMDDMTVADAVECGFVGLEAALGQITW